MTNNHYCHYMKKILILKYLNPAHQRETVHGSIYPVMCKDGARNDEQHERAEVSMKSWSWFLPVESSQSECCCDLVSTKMMQPSMLCMEETSLQTLFKKCEVNQIKRRLSSNV